MHICTACHRHVREAVCPFCGTGKGEARVVPGTMRIGTSRSALLVAGALAVAPAAGCSDAVSPDGSTDAQEVVSVDAVYGIDAGGPDAADAVDQVSTDAVYGIDGGTPDVADEDVGPSPPYGVPSDR